MTAPRVRRAETRIRLLLGVSVAGSAGFAAAYVLDAGVQAQGVSLAVAFAGLSAAFTVWSRQLVPQREYVEEREPLPSAPATRSAFAAVSPVAPLSRGRFLRATMAAALGSLAAALLFPLRSLRLSGPAPQQALATTPWQDGRRVVTEEGHPVRVSDVPPGTILTVLPEGFPEAADAPVVLIGMEPGQLRAGQGREDGAVDGSVDGVVAYSKLCTHAGCPVGQYDQARGHLVCPCHQSTFDARRGAVPLTGPAAHPLPQLPLAVDGGGHLVARGGLSAPPGAGYWSRP